MSPTAPSSPTDLPRRLSPLTLWTLAVALFATIFAFALHSRSTPRTVLTAAMSTATTSAITSNHLAPVWFVSHGGPPTMFDYGHPAYKAWSDVGRQIKAAHDGGNGPLKALLVVSAHWQSSTPGTIEVNTDEKNPLVYDYYGFPSEYYKVQVQSHNPASLNKVVLDQLNKAFTAPGSKQILRAVPTRRGLDHGVFVPFKVAFYPEGEALPPPGQPGPASVLPSTLPVVQITLPPTDDPESSLRLGQALRKLRTDHGVGIFSGGMGVHNLREFMMSFRTGLGRGNVPYAVFTDGVAKAVAGPAAQSEDEVDPRWNSVVELTHSRHYKGAHPTAEHFLPIPLAVGATFPNERLYNALAKQEGAMGWNIFSTLPKEFAKV